MTVGTFAASYTLNFSDENISGALNKSITLMLTGKTRLAGDYNGDLVVDAADYAVWRSTTDQYVTAYSGADGDGNGIVNSDDYTVWRSNYGQTASGSGRAARRMARTASVPEPAGIGLAVLTLTAVLFRGRRLGGRSGRASNFHSAVTRRNRAVARNRLRHIRR